MIIEVSGVDGSGKTTLIHSLRRLINEGGTAYAYERSFQSEGVRLLEAAASASERARPVGTFSREVVEHVRTIDLVRRSFDLVPYKGSRFQHVFVDGYRIEQVGRIVEHKVETRAILRLVSLSVAPDLVLNLRLDAKSAIERMRGRGKGDALLLAADPESQTQAVIDGLARAVTLCTGLGVPVFDMDATQKPEILVDRAIREVHNLLAA